MKKPIRNDGFEQSKPSFVVAVAVREKVWYNISRQQMKKGGSASGRTIYH
jgi:hypothetical protein